MVEGCSNFDHSLPLEFDRVREQIMQHLLQSPFVERQPRKDSQLRKVTANLDLLLLQSHANHVDNFHDCLAHITLGVVRHKPTVLYDSLIE